MREVTFLFEGTRHDAYLDEDNKWWREDGVHYRLDGHRPSSVLRQVTPLIKARAGTVVRINGVVAMEHDPGTGALYRETLGEDHQVTIVDGQAFLDFVKRAEAATEDEGWIDADEFFVYKAYELAPEVANAAWKAFFWAKRRQIIFNKRIDDALVARELI